MESRKVTGNLSYKLKFIFRLVDQITWNKKNKKGNYQSNPGFYFRHVKQTCLVFLKGNYHSRKTLQRLIDVVDAPRRSNSRKPDDIYEIVEQLWPGGRYLELFGRRHNLRNGWVTLSNQLHEESED